MITACVRAAVGDSVVGIEQKAYNGHWAEVILHAGENGIFQNLFVDASAVNAEVIEKDLWIKFGDKVKAFEGANDAIGTLVLKFGSDKELVNAMANLNSWIKIEVI